MNTSLRSRNRKIVILLVATITFVSFALVFVLLAGTGVLTGWFGLNQTQEMQNQNSLITGGAIEDLGSSDENIPENTSGVIPEIPDISSDQTSQINQTNLGNPGRGSSGGDGNYVSSPARPPRCRSRRSGCRRTRRR